MLFFSLVILLFASGTDALCETLVITYSSKLSEELPCPITDQTVTAAWNDETTQTALASYERRETGIEITINPFTKHNFRFYYSTTSFTFAIQNVEAEDEGEYSCTVVGEETTGHNCTVVVEVLVKPTVQYESQDVDVLDGIVGTSYEHFHVLAKPTVMNGSQDVDALNVIAGTSYDLTCSATGARSESDLSLVWDPSLVVKTPLSITPNGDDYKDYSITSTYTAVRGDSNITCKLTGYVMQDEINDQRMEHISHTVNLNVQYAPVCNMSILEGEDCREVTLTCECEAVPAGITQYSFFNGSNNLNDGTSNTSTVLVAYGNSSEFSCSATNDIGPGVQTDAKNHKCDMPVESGDSKTLGIVGSIVVMIAVFVIFVVTTVMMCKVVTCKPDEQGDEGALPTQPLNTRESVDGGHLN